LKKGEEVRGRGDMGLVKVIGARTTILVWVRDRLGKKHGEEGFIVEDVGW